MQDVPNNGVLAVQTLRKNLMASTRLASTLIMLSSILVILMTSSGNHDKLANLVDGIDEPSFFGRPHQIHLSTLTRHGRRQANH